MANVVRTACEGRTIVSDDAVNAHSDQRVGNALLHERAYLILRNGDERDRIAEFIVGRRDFHEEGANMSEILKDVQASSLRFDFVRCLLTCLPDRMRVSEQLGWNLSEVLDHPFDRLASDRIIDGVDVHRFLVRAVHEHVESIDCRLTCLLEAEDEVDPFVKMRGDVVGFERETVKTNEFLGGAVCPRRQLDVVQREISLLKFAEIEFIRIDQEFGQVEELGSELFHVQRRIDDVRPGGLKRVELSIGDVESEGENRMIEGAISQNREQTFRSAVECAASQRVPFE